MTTNEIRAHICIRNGCQYSASGYSPCGHSGCVESGKSAPNGLGPAGGYAMATAMARAHRIRRIASQDSGSGSDTHHVQDRREFVRQFYNALANQAVPLPPDTALEQDTAEAEPQAIFGRDSGQTDTNGGWNR